jgi:photosystem II stability/assembly factor-like uncharacterized protein
VKLSILLLACRSGVPVLLSLGLLAPSAFAEVGGPYVKTTDGKQPVPILAVDTVCAWPNLTVLSDGSIVATIFNKPSHGQMAGDVVCYASTDGGTSWHLRGIPARHEPRTNRMNVAAGLANDGDLIVLASGWSDELEPGQKPRHKGPFRADILAPWLCRSGDGGKTWSVDKKTFPPKIPNGYKCVPFGDILAGDDGMLRAAVYSSTEDRERAYIYRSSDDGKTWGEPVPLDKNSIRNETALCHLGDGKWLAAARTDEGDVHLYSSVDDARTWKPRGPVTGAHQHPGHLLCLRDGRILLSYGNRAPNARGVDVRFSPDEGKTWGKSIRVMDFDGDGGYPSSIQRPDGQVVTAYYARRIAGHDRYHMGVVIWDPAESTK